jgi:hypothetical protein
LFLSFFLSFSVLDENFVILITLKFKLIQYRVFFEPSVSHPGFSAWFLSRVSQPGFLAGFLSRVSQSGFSAGVFSSVLFLSAFSKGSAKLIFFNRSLEY